jgi:hypothetical protein
MWSLDPALHRLFMWCIRIGLSSHSPGLDPDKLLFYAKLPANALLVCSVGAALVVARRATPVTIFNVSLQFVLFIAGVVLLISNTGAGSTLGAIALSGTAVLLAIVIALTAIECSWRKRHQLKLFSAVEQPSAPQPTDILSPALEAASPRERLFGD